MSGQKKISSALISVYDKNGLEPIVKQLDSMGVKLISTGGTADYIRALGLEVYEVSDLTSFPSVFGGRVKTLHPTVFGGILYRRENESDVQEAKELNIPAIDLVLVDLYPFVETLQNTDKEEEIIEKIDIGGISLIRAAAKNYRDVLVMPSKDYYDELLDILKQGYTSLEQRKTFAARAFEVSAHYDTAIFNWFNTSTQLNSLKISHRNGKELRYGENPHQSAHFYAASDDAFEQLNGKDLSYNNLQDISAALDVLTEFEEGACVIVKHSNTCGVALRDKTINAWEDALSADPVSAFGGIIAFNRALDKETCLKISKVFIEVLIAPGFDEEGLNILKQKKNRIILQMKKLPIVDQVVKSISLGLLVQEADCIPMDFKTWTLLAGEDPKEGIQTDMEFAMRVVKHLKSNAVVLVKNRMLIGAGNGQTNRIDAVEQAIAKAKKFNQDIKDSVLASDAFFPFADSVELAYSAGVSYIVEPGGSMRDQETIDFCKEKNITLVFTGSRHFKH